MSLEGMSESSIREMEERLLQCVTHSGGTAGNISLLRELKWRENQYWSIRDRLVDAGRLVLGRGKGGSVRIVPEIGAQSSQDMIPAQVGLREEDVYEPLSRIIRDRWVRDQRFGRSLVEVTARQGRRDTGGTWTRPDIVVASLTTFLYLPGRHFEVVTFEVKTWDGLDITAVYEALAHQRASTRTYVLVCVSEETAKDDYAATFLQQVGEEAKRHGVGFIIVTNLDDYGTWDERVEAVHREPVPHMQNEFLSVQLPQGAKDQIVSWFR